MKLWSFIPAQAAEIKHDKQAGIASVWVIVYINILMLKYTILFGKRIKIKPTQLQC